MLKFIKNKNGFAVITVVGVMLILLILGASFVSIAKLEMKKSNSFAFMFKAKQAADSGFEYAYSIIKNHTDSLVNDFTYDADLGINLFSREVNIDDNTKFEIKIIDTNSMVNVNACNNQNFEENMPITDIDALKLYCDKINNICPLPFKWQVSIGLNNYLLFPEQMIHNNSLDDSGNYNDNCLYFTAHSYEKIDENRINLYQLENNNILDKITIEQAFSRLEYENNKADLQKQLLINIKDYFDADNDFTEVGEFIGLEACPIITEVMAKTSQLSPYASDTGLFIRIFNPCDEKIDLSKFQICTDTICWNFNTSQELDSHKSIILTDNINRLTDEYSPMINIEQGPEINNCNKIILKLKNTSETIIDTFFIDNVFNDKSIERGYIDEGIGYKETIWNDWDIKDNMAVPLSKTDNQYAGYIFPDHKQIYHNSNNPDEINKFHLFDNIYLKRTDGFWEYIADIEYIEDYLFFDKVYSFDNSQSDYFDNIDNTINQRKKRISGKININTASKKVLECLPGVDNNIAETIIAKRPYININELIRGLNNNRKVFYDIVNLTTTQSNCFIVIVRGIYKDEYEYTIKALIDKNDGILYRFYIDV